MHRSYSDLTNRLGEPLWWDEQAVPRYDPFGPHEMGVYDRMVWLYEIRCQDCPKRMKVAGAWNGMDYAELMRFLDHPSANIWTPLDAHYGDPPRHNCPGAGETMNCYDLEVLEVWGQDIEHWGWVRRPELEGPMEDYHIDEEL